MTEGNTENSITTTLALSKVKSSDDAKIVINTMTTNLRIPRRHQRSSKYLRTDHIAIL